MQQRNIIGLALVFLFLLETTVFHWVIPIEWKESIHITPHFVLIVILFIAHYDHRYFALFLGIVFGLLQDIVFYGQMIGPHAFGMGLICYLMGFLFQRSHLNFLTVIPIIMVGTLCFDLILYGIYRLFSLIEVSLDWSLLHDILPTFLFNLFFAVAIYIPIRYLIERIESQHEEKES